MILPQSKALNPFLPHQILRSPIVEPRTSEPLKVRRRRLKASHIHTKNRWNFRNAMNSFLESDNSYRMLLLKFKSIYGCWHNALDKTPKQIHGVHECTQGQNEKNKRTWSNPEFTLFILTFSTREKRNFAVPATKNDVSNSVIYSESHLVRNKRNT